ncbi:MAG TPA: hypothetical protein VK447_15810, partial [Myxococcaceae bacterium]|nr:hypothetical protein [Myxococcaceae bacterium]
MAYRVGNQGVVDAAVTQMFDESLEAHLQTPRPLLISALLLPTLGAVIGWELSATTPSRQPLHGEVPALPAAHRPGARYRRDAVAARLQPPPLALLFRRRASTTRSHGPKPSAGEA